MSKIREPIESPMWSVIFHGPNNARKVLFRSEQRGEAEAQKQRYQRLMAIGFGLEVVFEEPTTPSAV